jgi:hypothetical protein
MYTKDDNKNNILGPMWWYPSVILALGRLRQEDNELEASLGFTERSYPPKTIMFLCYYVSSSLIITVNIIKC